MQPKSCPSATQPKCCPMPATVAVAGYEPHALPLPPRCLPRPSPSATHHLRTGALKLPPKCHPSATPVLPRCTQLCERCDCSETAAHVLSPRAPKSTPMRFKCSGTPTQLLPKCSPPVLPTCYPYATQLLPIHATHCHPSATQVRPICYPCGAEHLVLACHPFAQVPPKCFKTSQVRRHPFCNATG